MRFARTAPLAPGAARLRSTSGLHVNKHLGTLSIASFFVAVIALCTFEILSVDFGWHLKTGELIWTTQSIPSRDVFSYIAEGRPWLDSHWLFQLSLFGAYSAAGIPGLYALRYSLVIAMFAFLLATNSRRQNLPVALIVCLLALFIAHQRFVMRPELVSLCCLVAFFCCIENLASRRRLCMLIVPLCQLLWANAHGLAILGIAFLALYVFGDALQAVAARRHASFASPAIEARELRSKFALLGLATLAYLANANGAAGILYPLEIFRELRGEVSSFPMLEELAPPLSTEIEHWLDPIALYRLLIAISALSLLSSWRRLRLAHVFVYAAFLYLSTLANRNMSLFAIVAAPIAIRNLSELLERVRASRGASTEPKRIAAAALATAMALIAAGTWAISSSNLLYERLGWPRTFGVGVSDRFAADALERLAALEGRFFNSPDLGGFLIWQLYPSKQVAIDGRWEVYGDLLPELQRAYSNPEVFARLVDEYDIVAVVLGTRTAPAVKMARWLRRSRDWHLTLRSKHVELFERLDRIER